MRRTTTSASQNRAGKFVVGKQRLLWVESPPRIQTPDLVLANGFLANGFRANGFRANGFRANGFRANDFRANGFRRAKALRWRREQEALRAPQILRFA